MYRVKDLIGLEVYDYDGKKLGEIQDLAIDYYNGKVLGFWVQKSIFKKENFFSIESILTIGEKIIVDKLLRFDGLKFNDIKNLDIIDKNGKMIGVVEDILIDRDFNIKALSISKGVWNKFKIGKTLLLISETILGDKNILCFNEEKIRFKSLVHSIWR